MDQIYNFEAVKPPVLNENMLHAEQERRSARRMAVLFTLAAAFMLAMVVWFAISIVESAPIAAFVCIAYAAFSLLGGGTIAIVYAQKGGVTT